MFVTTCFSILDNEKYKTRKQNLRKENLVESLSEDLKDDYQIFVNEKCKYIN